MPYRRRGILVLQDVPVRLLCRLRYRCVLAVFTRRDAAELSLWWCRIHGSGRELFISEWPVDPGVL